MEYDFKEIEKKWQKKWAADKKYKVEIDDSRPKYYVLDMFPYPSGAGLHVGHPLGYIASDIYSRFKRQKGFNVLHPMGYDAFGLPAEQYAIQTGQHPAVTTENNIRRYREQMDKLGFSYDWDREIRTCDKEYYHWTQWAFLKMFGSYYCYDEQQARPIEELKEAFGQFGTQGMNVACTTPMEFTAAEWNAMDEKRREEVLQNYRLAYRADTVVNWCPALGTVLANDEVIGGLSERGGHPVVQKQMKQWLLRITAYSQRLIDGLDTIDWSESLKEIQRNWIGRSEGAQVFFGIKGMDEKLEVFTTRPDTIFGATFMVLAPEHELVSKITTGEYAAGVNNYLAETKKRSERERMADAKRISGQFTGGYALNPFNGDQIPVYISDYVLAGYGTGAIMAVPAHDSRDYAFAKHFGLPIIPVVEGGDISMESYDAKEGRMINSDFINGLDVKDAIRRMFEEVEKRSLGKKKINYRLRDAIFSRQRYWGEPIPIYYKDGTAYPLDESKLPLELPAIDNYGPTAEGEPPLARAKDWRTEEGYPLETSTMPGFAGSSAYYIRYMDPRNDKALASPEAINYWRNVDLYLGGIEHATGHLMYSRFWNMFLYDIGVAVEREPFKKLVNQGMIQGRSNFVYRLCFPYERLNDDDYKRYNNNLYVSKKYADEVRETDSPTELIRAAKEQLNLTLTPDVFDFHATIVSEIHVDVNFVRNDILDLEAFRKWRPEFADAEFILEDGKYVCGWAVEKMSKSMYNVVNPDRIVEDYGADTMRLYEMFLGPLEQSKPWDTNGIDGVHKFLRRLWRLFFDREGRLIATDEKPTAGELKSLHKCIRKVSGDIEDFSFNTAVSASMICLNELNDVKCHKKEILEPFVKLLAPFAPHITEEIWSLLGHKGYILEEAYPEFDPKFLIEDSFEYPVSFNGKLRFKKVLPAGLSPKEIEEAVLADPQSEKYTGGNIPKKVIVVPGKIVNIVV